MSVFGALNRFISRLDADPGQFLQSQQQQGQYQQSQNSQQQQQSQSQQSRSRGGACGFQILRNGSNDIPLEPWYDFIVGINGRQIDNPDAYLFSQEVKNCAGSSVSLVIWSAKGQQMRDIQLPIPAQDPRLGLTLQWTPLAATEHVWHILEVIPDSPADQAGLLPYGDYIIGTPEGNVHGESGLGELVEDFLARPLRLWVYNNEYAVTRPVTITPSRSWGGEGALGCILGYGALHRLPPALNEPPAAPGDTLFETARFSNEEPSENANGPPPPPMQGFPPSPQPPLDTSSMLTGASMTAPPPLSSTTQPPPARGARKGRKGAAANSQFEDMWKEGEEKSKEEFTPAKKADNAPPPPPKAAPGAGTKPPPKDGVASPAMLSPGASLRPGIERAETASPAPIFDESSDD